MLIHKYKLQMAHSRREWPDAQEVARKRVLHISIVSSGLVTEKRKESIGTNHYDSKIIAFKFLMLYSHDNPFN